MSMRITWYRRLAAACVTLVALAVGIGAAPGVHAEAQESAFVSTWNTTNTSTGSSAANEITLPLTSTGEYNFSVDWGDGSTEQVLASGSTGVTHTYATPGEKTIRITGTIEGWRFANTGDRLKLLDISEWGPLQLGNTGGYFHGAANLNITATDAPDLTGTTDLSTTFLGASTLNADLSGWNVSAVTSMRSMFQNANAFNGNITGWNVGNVRTMNSMFRGATAFDRDISEWTVSSVTNMASMFRDATAFDQDLSRWDVSRVADMAGMFSGVALPIDTYDELLQGWALLELEPGVDFDAGTSYYNPTVSADARATLTDQYAWSITDAGAAGVPTAPAAPSAVAGSEAATVTWAAPPDNNSAIVRYTVTATPGDFTCTVDAPALTCDVTGLTNNTTYRFSVTATNAVGTSTASALSNAVTPQTTQPSTPAKPFAAALDGAAQIWVARGSGGGVPDTYTVTASPGPGTCTVTAATETSCTIAGLENGTDYTFTATATNEFGTSGTSVPSDVIAPTIPFTTTWLTTNMSGAATDNRSVRLPLVADGTYNFRVSWGDGTGTVITNANWASARDHRYATAGQWTVTITGTIRGWNFNTDNVCGWGGNTDRNKLIDVSAWGPLRLDSPTEMTNYFCNAENLQITATDAPNTAQTTSLAGAFQGARTLNADLGHWNVSEVTDMTAMFQSASAFNGDISGWNTSKVTTMYAMFNGATAFNRSIGGWNTGSVTNMAYMFQSATNFDQPLNGWDTADVTTMFAMFNNAARFNQPLNLWNTGQVTTMYAMFQSAAKFNQDLTGWSTGSVTTMNRMFNAATDFNGSLAGWNTSAVTNLEYAFANTRAFNGDISGWNTSSVTRFFGMFQNATAFNGPLDAWGTKTGAATSMGNMFYGATAFNQPIGSWSVGEVRDMSQMFYGATAFNQSLNGWNVGNVTSLVRTFTNATAFNGDITLWNVAKVTSLSGFLENAAAFNRDIGAWNTSAVTDMSSAFKGAAAFNQDLRAWDMGGVTNATAMFTGSALGTANYNRMLYSWAYGSASDGVTNGSGTGVVTDNVPFSGGSAKYSIGLPTQARAVLVARGWSISDGGSTNGDVPNPPTDVSQPATGTTRTVTWTAPADRPSPATNPAVTSYRVKAYSSTIPTLVDTGLGCTATAPDVSCDVEGLVDGGTYFFSVVATNTVGDSDPSQMSVPAAPSAPVAQSRFEAIKVGWFPQPTSGGDPVSYTVTADPGGAFCTITVPEKTCVISGLENGQAYTVTAIATNALGDSAVSDVSTAVTPGSAFVSTWRTNNSGTSNPQQITLPLVTGDGGSYNFLVSWGDGTTSTITSASDPNVTHTYAARGDYDVTITGTIQGWRFANGGDREKLVQIERWGPLQLGNGGNYFQGASRMTVTATDPINLAGTTDLSYAFAGASLFNGAIGNWDTSAVTTMSNMFSGASRFNADIGDWETGNVTNMSRMFISASAFNKPLADWDTSKVTDMSGMFYSASAFNQPIGGWNTANVTRMQDMFLAASRFNQPLNTWNTAKVTDMSRMFWAANAFNQDLNSWNTGLVTNMYGMFLQASAFNGAIGNWNTANVTNMQQMFQQSAFNQPIGFWNTSNVTNMAYMFNSNTAFNQPLGLWDTGKVTTMYQMFVWASAFNQSLENWNTSSVTGNGFEQMFYGATAFNGALTNWDVSKATNLRFFLYNARAFNQDLSKWNVSNVSNFEYMFHGTSMRGDVSTWNVTSATNMQFMFWAITPPAGKNLLRGTPWYNKILIAWAKQNLKPNVSIHFRDTGYADASSYPKYSVGQDYPTVVAAAAQARATLTSFATGGKRWSITDGGSTNVDAPGVPTNVTFSRTGASENGSQATITWEPPIDGDLVTPMTYEVVSTRDAAFRCETAGLTCVITGLPVDDRATSFHQFSVRGVNSIGDSDWSTPLPAVRTPALPQPQFGTVTQTEYGFTVPITNYTDTYDWSGTATQGSVTISSTGIVTVGSAETPVMPDTTSTATITAGRFGYADQSATVGSRALKQKLVPALDPVVRTPGGFTATITNYDSDYTWTPTLSVAGTVTIEDVGALKVLTVTGLADGASGTATLTTTRTGHAAGVLATTGTALDAPLVPTYGAVTRTADGFRAPITNYDAAYDWAEAVAPTGNAAIVTADGTTSIVVTDVAPDTEVTVTLDTSRSGYLPGQSTLTSRSYKAALAFTLGTPVPTADGYTVGITGYTTDGWTWSGAVTASGEAIAGGVVAIADGVATVSGLDPNTTADLTITATRDDHAPATQSTTATSLMAALVPTIAEPVSTPDGFTAVITNYEEGGYVWSATGTAGTVGIETAVVDSVTVRRVVVTGLSPFNPSTVTLRTVRAGYADGVTVFTASSLRAKLDPTFGSVTRLAGGFSVPIANFDGETYNPSDYTWTATTNRGDPVAASVDAETGVVTVTGLADGTDAILTVANTRTGYAPGSSTISGTALEAPLTPALGTPTAGVLQATLPITNFDGSDGNPTNYTWSATTDGGPGVTATVDTSSGVVTVTGLAHGQSVEVTVTTTRTNHRPGSATTTAAALLAPLVPDLSAPEPIAGGFRVSIANYATGTNAGDYSWSVSHNGGGAVTVSEISAGGVIDVTGLALSDVVRLTVGTTRSGHAPGSAWVDGSPLQPALTPTFGAVTRLDGGFEVEITNYLANQALYTFAATTNGGDAVTASIDPADGVATITGLTTGETVRLTVTTTRSGHAQGSAFIDGAALESALTPTFGAPTAEDGAFTVAIDNYDAAYTWGATTTAGSLTRVGGLVTVSGLSVGQSATVEVTTTRTGYLSGSAQVTGTARRAALTPQFGTVERLDGGFRVPITNYDGDFTWTLTPATGASIVDGSLVVTGLTDGASATVNVATSRIGYLAGDADATGAALGAKRDPSFGAVTALAGSFTVQIANYDAAYTWTPRITAGSGTAVINGTGLLTVSGLGTGDSATVAVDVTRDGYLPGTGQVTGRAKQTALTPTFGPVSQEIAGFMAEITNYDPTFLWSFSTTAGSVMIVDVGGSKVLTVSSLGRGERATVTVRTENDGFFDGTATVSGRAVLPALTPSYGTTVRGVHGFTTPILNYDTDYDWVLTPTNGAAEIVDVGGVATLTVTGLTDGQPSTVTVEVDDRSPQDPSIRTTTTVASSALDAALVPEFDAITRGDRSFTVQILNYNGAYGWTPTTTSGSAAISGTGLVTVSGLLAEQTATLTVATARDGYRGGTASVEGQALAAALTPAFGTLERLDGGFRVPIDNYDPSFTWTLTPSSGASIVDGALVVTGLADGGSATIAVATSRTGHVGASGSVTGTALDAELVPSFGTPVPVDGGFTVQITNYDADFAWTPTSTAGAASVNGSGLLTVTGLGVGETATVTVATARAGYVPGSAQVVGRALRAARTPEFGAVVRTTTGFTVQITNYDAAFTWTPTATAGTPTIDGSGLLTVSGLTLGVRSTVTVTTAQTGFFGGSASVSGRAVLPALTPTFDPVVRGANGFTAVITNYDADYAWAVAATPGTAAIVDVSGAKVLTVTGLADGEAATVTIEVDDPTPQDPSIGTSTTVDGSALDAARVPTFGTPVPGDGRFTVQIGNYAGAFTWTATTTAGSAAIDSSGLVTVTGLGIGQEATLTVTATRSGYLSGAATLEGRSLQAARTPAFGTVERRQGGYAVEITNHDPAFTWTPSTTAGAVEIVPVVVAGPRTAQMLTVTGLADGQSATVTLDTTRAGYFAGTADVTDAALAAALLTPTLGTPIPLRMSFRVPITNYDPAYTWSATTDVGSARVIDVSGAKFAEVYGIGPLQEATVTVHAGLVGHLDGTASILGAADVGGQLDPGFATAVPTADGFIADINNYDAAYTWTASATAGVAQVVLQDGQWRLVVTGVAPDTEVSATVGTTRPRYDPGSATIASRSLKSALAPRLATAVPVSGGFVADVRAYNARFTWSVTTSAGTATITDQGVVKVTGLPVGDAATITVRSTRSGYVQGAEQLTGTSLGAALNPTFTGIASTTTEATATIANYDPSFQWAVTADQGTASIGAGGVVQVQGLVPGTGVSVTVRSTRGGFESGAGSFNTNAQPLPRGIVAATVPDRPRITRITAGPRRSILVAWRASGDGGSPILSARVSCVANGRTVTAQDDEPVLRVLRLRKGKKYACRLTVTNVVGASLKSQVVSVRVK